MSESLFHFGDLSLDEHQRVLLRNGRRVPLPAKALSTLLVLVRNSGCVVEKEVLLEEVWPNEYVEEANISQHIYILRKALGESTDSHSYIETIPRRGYRFVTQATESRRRVHTPEINSIAVLPFEIASNEPNLDYLSTGITESIMNNLSRIETLKVMARSSVFHFKGADPREAGERLGVPAVLVGSVQKVEERLVICAELVDVKDGSQIWGEHYHRSSDDILLLQEEVGWEISENLRFRLGGKQPEDLTKPE
jgi:TolB-like protein